MVAKQIVPPCDMVGDATVVLRENTRRVYATEILDNAVEVAPPARRVHHIRYRLSPSQFQQAPMARTIEHGGICGSHTEQALRTTRGVDKFDRAFVRSSSDAALEQLCEFMTVLIAICVENRPDEAVWAWAFISGLRFSVEHAVAGLGILQSSNDVSSPLTCDRTFLVSARVSA